MQRFLSKAILKIAVIGASLIAVGLLGLSVAMHRTISSTETDPTGNYVAEVSYRTMYSFLAMSPGSSSDKPAFVEIFTKDGDSLGRIPVPMLQMSGVKWAAPGALVELVGEWDFAKGTCFYWSENGNKKIYVAGAPSS
jgi:hypothetical protein